MMNATNNAGAAAPPVTGRGEDMDRLRSAAQEFEAAMLNAWWQAMQSSFPEDGEGSLSGDPGVLQDLSRQTMSAAIAEAGGIGFSRMILEQLQPTLGQQAKVPGESADL